MTSNDFGYGFGDNLTDMRKVFEQTAAAFEKRRARPSR